MLILCLSNNKRKRDQLMIASDCIDERKPRLRNSDVFALPDRRQQQRIHCAIPADLISNVLSGITRFIINAMIPGASYLEITLPQRLH
ncbi:hypothetical protein A676_04153 [Salmonella enterica subsp. enterica serovar Enteritidis str. 2010K-0262]|uniref:Uncharacterized protein n=1 Tax=Salmonella enterica subsp. enterica serovar Cubana str. 76814 TaxID=1192560 RepID=V7IJ75_SALET|nr:hypothetical protein A676_04153 [Salmonella enterica subsp. enterica serovar Enteritidis str. 2010K-0262]EPI93373.1 hypothetical protein A678_04992 [Salmonella enterica subsp. enterica serovar Enteritidis str. 2010K-0271]ETA85374.1 hypothetical protein A628_04650 [Salmonella enterica subsp. enterica serovar Cubana str. 76814]